MSHKELAAAEMIYDRYRIRETLGQGMHGRTLLAHDTLQNRDVVLKVLSVQSAADWKTIELFERGAQTLHNLSHSQIPALYDTFYDDEAKSYYLVQEYIEGTDLRSLLAQNKRWNEQQLNDFLHQMLDIFDYLHGMSPPVIHRDIKPSNIMQTLDGRYILIDFDVVQTVIMDDIGGSTVVGTTGYMAPEQMWGSAVPASDLYGLGATTLHLATGTHPMNIPLRRGQLDFRSLSPLSDAANQVLERLLNPDLKQRFAKPSQVRSALSNDHEIQQQQVIYAPPVIPGGHFIDKKLAKKICWPPHAGSRTKIKIKKNKLIVSILSRRPNMIVGEAFIYPAIMLLLHLFCRNYFKHTDRIVTSEDITTIFIISALTCFQYITKKTGAPILSLVSTLTLGYHFMRSHTGYNASYFALLDSVFFIVLAWNLYILYRQQEEHAFETGIEQHLIISEDRITLHERSKLRLWRGGKKRALESWSFPRADLRQVYVRAFTQEEVGEVETLLMREADNQELMPAGLVMVDKNGVSRLIGQDVARYFNHSWNGHFNAELEWVLNSIQLYIHPTGIPGPVIADGSNNPR